MNGSGFLLAVITTPGEIPGEADLLEGILAAGAERLHLRKPGGSPEGLLERLAPRWHSRLVVHGRSELARRYGVRQVHGPAKGGDEHIRRSTSVHSWEEFRGLPSGLEYAFISPVFDSISKRGYRAAEGLVDIPPVALPCPPVALGGISAGNIGLLLDRGWRGAAVLGWLWEEPQLAPARLEQLKRIVDGQTKRVDRSGL